MKKAIFDQYGGLETIKIITAEKPKVSNQEVLVKVVAAGLNPKDILVRKGKFKRFSGKQFPQTIGFEFSGLVEDSKSEQFQKGDRVFGMINGWKGRCCAEFAGIKNNELTKAPENITHQDLAGISLVGQTALQAIRDIGKLKAGQRICINGASGGVGTLAIQIAKALGGRVTAVSSKKNTSFCAALGADDTIAYDERDVLEKSEPYDVFFDVFGNFSFRKVAPLLATNGIYITTVPNTEIFKEQLLNFFRKKKAKMIIVKSKANDLKWLANQLEEGKIRPVTDRVFPLENIKEAQQYIESKRAKGKVILQIRS